MNDERGVETTLLLAYVHPFTSLSCSTAERRDLFSYSYSSLSLFFHILEEQGRGGTEGRSLDVDRCLWGGWGAAEGAIPAFDSPTAQSYNTPPPRHLQK